MFKKYSRRPLDVVAFQFTREMQNDLIALGSYEFDKYLSVKVPNIPDAETEWDWSIQQLYIKVEGDFMNVNVGDFIVKEPFNKKRKYNVITREMFLITYEDAS